MHAYSPIEANLAPCLCLGIVGKQLQKMPTKVAVVFKPQPDKLAVLYLAKRSKGSLTGAETGSILGDSVDPGLFPL